MQAAAFLFMYDMKVLSFRVTNLSQVVSRQVVQFRQLRYGHMTFFLQLVINLLRKTVQVAPENYQTVCWWRFY